MRAFIFWGLLLVVAMQAIAVQVMREQVAHLRGANEAMLHAQQVRAQNFFTACEEGGFQGPVWH